MLCCDVLPPDAAHAWRADPPTDARLAAALLESGAQPDATDDEGNTVYFKHSL